MEVPLTWTDLLRGRGQNIFYETFLLLNMYKKKVCNYLLLVFLKTLIHELKNADVDVLNGWSLNVDVFVFIHFYFLVSYVHVWASICILPSLR